MSRCITYPPACSYGGTTQVALPPPAKTTSISLEPVCRYVEATQQTVVPPVSE